MDAIAAVTPNYVINVCARCQNYTAFVLLETYQVGSEREAHRLVAEEGFRNLTEVKAAGSHCQDHHAVHAQMPGVRVVAVSGGRPDNPEENERERHPEATP
jgi:hypothetical protein